MLEHANYNTLLKSVQGGNVVLPAESPVAIPQTEMVPGGVPALPNIVAVDTLPTKTGFTDTEIMIAAGLGIGALLLLPGKGSSKSVGGMGKKKSSMTPLLIVGGAALAYYFYTQSQGVATPAAVTTTAPPPVTNSTAAIQTAIQNSVPTGFVQGVPIPDSSRPAFILSEIQTLNNYWPGIKPILPYVSDTDIQTLNTYFFGFVATGTAVTPNMPSPHQNLYNDIAAIKSKYNIQF